MFQPRRRRFACRRSSFAWRRAPLPTPSNLRFKSAFRPTSAYVHLDSQLSAPKGNCGIRGFRSHAERICFRPTAISTRTISTRSDAAIERQRRAPIHERDINQMVQTGNLSRLRQWTQSTIADNGVFNRTNSVETEGQSRAVASITITKSDLLRLQRFVLSGMAEKLNSVEDFRLAIPVLNIQPVGDSAAIVKSRVSERASLAQRQAELGGRGGQQREVRTEQGAGGQGN